MVNTIFVSDISTLSLELPDKSGKIEYLNLKTPNANIDLAFTGLSEINNATTFHSDFQQFKFNSVEFSSKGSRLNAVVTFTFHRLHDVLDIFYLGNNPNGKIGYRILDGEELLSTNGVTRKENGMQIIEWEEDTQSIQLKLKRTTLNNEDPGDLIKLGKLLKN